MPFLTRKDAILAKTEVTYGTDPTPTGAANAMLVTNLDMGPAEQTLVDRALNRPYFGASEQLPAQMYQRVSFEVELAGAGSAGTAPSWGPLLEACAFTKTISAGVKVDYTPISPSATAMPSVTIYCYKDGILHKLTGARGTVSLDLPNQGIPRLKFAFLGQFALATDATLSGAVYTAFQKPVICNGTNTTPFTLHSISPVASSLTIDMGLATVYRDLIGGTKEVVFTDRQASGAITFEMVSVATKNWLQTIQNATTSTLALTHGLVAGNIIKLAAPAVQLIQPKYSDMDGISMFNANLRFVPSSGNDELTITVQ